MVINNLHKNNSQQYKKDKVKIQTHESNYRNEQMSIGLGHRTLSNGGEGQGGRTRKKRERKGKGRKEGRMGDGMEVETEGRRKGWK